MQHYKAFNKDGKAIGTVMGKNKEDALARARGRNSNVESVGDRLPDVNVVGEVSVRQSEYADGKPEQKVEKK